ncbi:hypothetical protein J6590_034837 [Homalodisca vitripennis]|nr:hypothetical protein J6590_034837 [Homalodisca vitripennis]
MRYFKQWILRSLYNRPLYSEQVWLRDEVKKAGWARDLCFCAIPSITPVARYNASQMTTDNWFLRTHHVPRKTEANDDICESDRVKDAAGSGSPQDQMGGTEPSVHLTNQGDNIKYCPGPTPLE